MSNQERDKIQALKNGVNPMGILSSFELELYYIGLNRTSKCYVDLEEECYELNEALEEAKDENDELQGQIEKEEEAVRELRRKIIDLENKLKKK